MSENQKKHEYVVIAGSREFPNMGLVREWIDKHMGLKPGYSMIVSGGARGVDSVAVAHAKRCGYDVKEFHADWDKYGKSAGAKRNAVMAKVATRAFIFWDGHSPGTQIMVKMLSEKKKPFVIIYPDGRNRFYSAGL